ncbi:hypothetical protein [Piscirickettsia litoralis]|uniref:hypothetical protein n=1 Tax=Piscirickettsia litoralis TaxID=1891921 RepID=UPI001112CC5A|nr:hypothetical protein [Piscirickettsia litoralis]
MTTMIITLGVNKLRLSDYRPVSIRKSTLILSTAEGQHQVQFRHDNPALIQKIRQYILSCMQRGFKRLNLDHYLKSLHKSNQLLLVTATTAASCVE